MDQELSPKALQALLTTLKRAASGDFKVRMEASGDGVEREVADAINDLVSQLAEFTSELERVSESVSQGDLRARLPLDKANGGWGQQLRAVNNVVATFGRHVAELRRVVKAVHGGDMSRPVNVAPESTHRGGELARAAEEINAMITHLSRVTAEITRVFAEVGLDGRLNAQCHISDADGSWGLLVGSVNAAGASLSEQVQDLCVTAQALAAGNLAARATVTSRGDLQTLKLGLNGAADGLSALCNELRRVAQEVVTEGKLSVELRHPDPRGEWMSAQQAVNRMLNAMANAWRNVTAQLARAADSDYALSQEAVPPGELGAPEHALTRLGEQQQRIQGKLQALIEGRFAEIESANDNARDLIIMQLGLRLKREWFRSVRAGIYEARELPSPERFAGAVLHNVVESTQAVAGAYYSVSSDQRIVRTAILGCEVPAAETAFQVGEGLVGKVAATCQPLLLDQLDQPALRVRSGLIELSPRALLVFPIVVDGRAQAVFELLFVSETANSARELLEYLAPDVARGVRAPGAPAELEADAAQVRALQEDLVIASARIESLENELQRSTRVAS